MAKMKEQSKTSERELNNEEIDNLPDGEFKALVIKMLTYLIELGQKMKRQMKDTQNEIKQNIQGTNSDRKETRTQINDLEEKEAINIQLEQNEETRIQKSEGSLTNLWDNLKCSNIQIIGVPEREEQQQEIKNLFEQIMKENFPNLSKEIDFQDVPEAQRIPKKLDPKRNTPRHTIIKLPKMKDKETILKAARGKERVTYKGVPIRLSADFSKETLQARRGWKEVFQVMKVKDLHPRLLYPAKLLFKMEGQIKCFPNRSR